MRSNSKAVRDKVKQHILDSVYDENENEFKSIDKASEYLAGEFKRVADYPHNLHRIPNHQERFTDYLRGIPFHFEYMDYKIEEFLNGLGINPKGKKYDSDQMWKTYGALIWREVAPKYHSKKSGGTVEEHMGASDLETLKKGGKVRPKSAIMRDRYNQSHEKHELAYDRKTPARNRKYVMGGDLDKIMFMAGGVLPEHMNAGDLDFFEKGGKVTDNRPRLKRGDKVFMLCRRWFQKSYGNTYHSVDVFVNNELVGRLPFEYGYGDHCLTTGLRALFEAYKPPYKWTDRSANGTFVNSARKLKDYGIKFDYEIVDVDRKKDLEQGGAIDDLMPERDLIVPFGKGGEIMKRITSGEHISEKDMKLILRRMNNDKLDDEMREVIQHIWNDGLVLDPDGAWTEKGLKFLKNQWKTPTGKERKNNPFGYREQDILDNFAFFGLVGFYDVSKYGGVSYYVPLYEVCDKNGWCFQYYYDGKVNIVGMMGGLFGAPRSTHSIRMDRMWTSQQPHEQAYKSKRKSKVKNSGKDRKLESQEPHEVAGRKKMLYGGWVNGTYGSGQTPATIYTYADRGGTWYAVDGSTGVNFTYDPVEDGVDVETLSDEDFFTSGFPIESTDDIERAVEE